MKTTKWCNFVFIHAHRRDDVRRHSVHVGTGIILSRAYNCNQNSDFALFVVFFINFIFVLGEVMCVHKIQLKRAEKNGVQGKRSNTHTQINNRKRTNSVKTLVATNNMYYTRMYTCNIIMYVLICLY